MTQKSVDDIIFNLKKKVSRNEVILHGLENNEAFKMLLEDFENSKKAADDNWHLIKADEMPKLFELKCVKLAANSIINILDAYKHDIKQARQQLNEMEHPDKYQGGYYDNE